MHCGERSAAAGSRCGERRHPLRAAHGVAERELLNKRPVYVKVTRMDPASGGGAQFKIRAREATIYGRWLTAGYDYHVELENTTADAMCVEVVRYPASGLSYAPGPGWSGAIDVHADGAGIRCGGKGDCERELGRHGRGRALRVSACAAPTNLVAGGAAREHLRGQPRASRTSTSSRRRRTRARRQHVVAMRWPSVRKMRKVGSTGRASPERGGS